MSRIGKIARRTFLIGSAAVVGGVAFGVYKLKQPAENPLLGEPGRHTLNPFLFIDGNGITLIAPKAEMGQGVHTTWAALIAEELDVELDQVNVIHGPPAKAYYNSALFGMALPFHDFEVGPIRQEMRSFVGDGAKLLGLQLTGGSTTARDGYERMREVGSSARETFKQAAANRWNMNADRLTTQGGQVIAPDGSTLSYVELAPEAAELDPPRVKLRDPSQWRLLGKTQPRIDMVGKVTGTAEFAADVRLPGMKFATVRRSPKRGNMVSFDASAAQAMPGVEKIVDLGDGIAVIASNTWLAMQAAEAVQITWSPADYPATSDQIWRIIEAGFDGEVDSTPRDDGDVDGVEGGTTVTAEYRIPFLAHTTMEPMNATALYTADKMTVWSGNQAPISTRDKCAAAVGLESEQVEVITPFMGGGFGRRAETDFSVVAAKVAQALPGVPVKTIWSREEDTRNDFYRPAAMARYRGVVRDGQAVMLDGQVSAPSMMRNSGKRSGAAMPGPDKETVAGSFDQPYEIENFRIRGYTPALEVPLGYWRSVGNSMNGFFFDSFIDEMAHAAGRDPLEFRHEMIAKVHEPSAKVLEAVRDMSGWTGQTPEGIGRGVAFTYSFGSPVAEVIEVRQTDAGIRISDIWIAADVGVALDPGNLEAQLSGGALYGLSAAVMEEITFADAQAEQGNFYDYDALRMHNAPRVHVKVLENNPYIGGVGEPGTPPAPAALANALFDLTGQRARELPLNRSFDLLV
jgi:isoquinoline 1-oxidoreductase beta subunit